MSATSLPNDDDETGGIVAEINITPLTDIFLVLLIIFMVTTSVIVEEGKNLELPSATESEETPDGVTVAVTADGAVQINDRVIEPGQLESALAAALEAAESKVVILRGDRRVLLGQAVNILDLAQSAGAKSIALATKPPEEDGS